MVGAKTLVESCAGVKKGEKVAIITDTKTLEVAEMLAAATLELGAEPVISVMIPRTRHGEEPPAHVAEMMKAADVVFMPTVWSMTHSNARREANKAGARVLSLPDYSLDVLSSSALKVDFLKLTPIVRRMSEKLTAAASVHIKSSSGTDLVMDVSGRIATFQSGTALEPGQWSPPPCVEATVSPREGSTNGIAVIDGALIPGGAVKQPVRMKFVDGGIVSVEGGDDAAKFSEYLESFKCPSIKQVVELGMALNPGARIGGSMLEAEGAYGTVHLGLGEGRTFGSSITAPAHLDIVMKAPDLYLDGALVLSNRELVN